MLAQELAELEERRRKEEEEGFFCFAVPNECHILIILEIPQEVTVVILKPDIVSSDKIDKIIEEVCSYLSLKIFSSKTLGSAYLKGRNMNLQSRKLNIITKSIRTNLISITLLIS